MVNIRELLINAVSCKEPKMLTGSAQKGCGWIFPCFLEIHGQIRPPANRQDLNHSFVSYAEHGKPASPPQKASEPQGTPLEVQAADCGKSESHSVAEWIGIERKQHHPT